MPTITTPEAKTRTITMSDRAPLRIREEDWPILAKARGQSKESHNGTPVPEHEVDHYYLTVRQHQDGRTIVYAHLDANPSWTGSEDRREGEVLGRLGEAPTDADLVAAIRRIGERCGLPDRMIRDCIADLPAEEV